MGRRSEEVGHRRSARFPLAIPVHARLLQFGEQEIPGRLKDISAGGVLVEFPVCAVPGSAVALVLRSRHGQVKVQGQVAWVSRSGDRIIHGIAFTEMKNDDFAAGLCRGEHP